MKLLLTTIITLAYAATVLSQRQRVVRQQAQQNCVTPENYYGSCVLLTYCPQIANVFQTNPRYVFAAQRSCGTRSVNGDPVVCCTRPMGRPQPQPQPQVTQRPTNPFLPTTQAPVVFQPTPTRNTRNPQTPITAAPTAAPTQPPTAAPSTAPLIDSRGPNCRDPNLREGVCIALQSCDELVKELYAKQTDSSFANYLRSSNAICGGSGSTICCPTGGVTRPTTAPVVIKNSNDVPRRPPTVEEGCGYTSNAYKKIVGGTVSKRGAWPWIALLGYNDGISASPFKCGGALVTARHVVTAAHCVRSDLTFARLGEHDLTTDTEAKHVDINVVRKEAHPKYNRRNGHSDVAVLYLERNVEFTSFISPICLPTTPALTKKSYISYNPFVIGWGKTMEGGNSASVLQELQIPIYSNDVCVDRYRAQNRLISNDQFDSAVLCAGVLSGGKDTCQGDSGGPLMIPESYQNNVRYYLIGVVSYGIGCARPEVPGVYASVQHFIDWITEKIADTN